MAKKGQLLTGEFDLSINQGDDFILQLVIKDSNGNPSDITGNNYVLRVRETAQDTNVIVEGYAELLEPTEGLVEFHFRDEDTSTIPVEGDYYNEFSKYTYDIIQITPEREVTRLLNGMLFVSPGVSYH